MADTFSIDSGNAVAQQPGPAASPSEVNLRAGQTSVGFSSQSNLDTRQNDATTDALLKLGSDLLQPKIKEAAEAQFLQGVQQIQDGAALKDVVEGRPWWAEVFGPSSAVQGARAYTVQKQVSDFAGKMEQQMPRLSQEDPEALTAAASALMKTLRTGDAFADTKIMGAITEQMAPLYKRHAKERFAYLQGKASDAQVQAWVSDAATLQSQLSAHAADPTKVTAADVEGIKAGFLSRFVPFGDQTDDSYEKNVFRFASMAGAQGNFQAVKLMQDTGITKALGPEYQVRLDASLRHGAVQALGKVNAMHPELATEAGLIAADYTINPAKVAERMQAFNEKVAKITGVPTEYGSYFNPTAFDNQVARTLSYQASQGAQVDAAAAKAAAEAKALQDAGLSLGSPGAAARMKAVGQFKDADLERAVAMSFDVRDPVKAAAVANNLYPEPSNYLQGAFAPLFSSEEMNEGVGRAMETARLMSSDARAKYIPDAKLRAQTERYLDLTAAGTPPKSAFAISRTLAPTGADAIPPKNKSAVNVAIRKIAEDKNEEWYGRNQITDASLRVIEGQIAGQLKLQDSYGVTETEEAVNRAYHTVMGAGNLQFVGKHVTLVQGKQPKVDLQQYYSTGADNIGIKQSGEMYDDLLTSKAKAAGASLDAGYQLRLPDVAGVPQWLAIAYKPDGQVVEIAMNGAEIKAHAKSARKVEAAPDAGREADIEWLKQRQRDLNPKRF